MSELKYWVWLSSLPGLSPASKARLPRRLGGVKETYFARAEDYERLDFLTPREREALENKGLGFANRAIEACLEGNIDIVTIGDANYPARLREIDAPPLVLYVRGRLPDIDELCAVAVVGTRDASLYGLRMAHNMGYGLTKCGALVVSGLTRGIDETAARGALQAGGGCVGVLGTPIDAVRPYAGIAYDVSLAGALVSEYAPGTPFSSRFFRERNRITSGLAAATLVVEAPAKSGALLFVSEALEQGREVFAVPGNADSARSEGSNRLIMEGAQPALTAWDILSGFAWRFPSISEDGKRKLPPEELVEAGVEAAAASATEGAKRGRAKGAKAPEKKKAKSARGAPKKAAGRFFAKKDVDKPEAEEYIDLKKQLSELSAAQLKIVAAITERHTHVDDIIERCGLPAAEVLGELTMLQIKGFVSQEPGKRFSLNITQK